MLDKTLTLASGKQALGEGFQEFQWTFTLRDPYIIAMQKLHDDEQDGALDRNKQEQLLDAAHAAWDQSPLKEHLHRIGAKNFSEDQFWEILWNAIEHGSDHCKMGPIVVHILHNAKSGKLLVRIDQPGKGFDPECIQAGTRRNIGNVLRGGGFSMIPSDPYAFGYEDLSASDGAKFRSLIFGAIDTNDNK